MTSWLSEVGEPEKAARSPGSGRALWLGMRASRGREKPARMSWHYFLAPTVTLDTYHFMQYFFQMCIVSSNGLLIPAKLFGLPLLLGVLVCSGLVSYVD